MNREFSNYHPIVNFSYFAIVIIYTMFFTNPICILISFICSFIYSILLNGKKAVKFNIFYMFPLLLLYIIINPIFNHEGITILDYFPNQNPLTLESIVYGIASAFMLVSTIFWFSCYNAIMTNDKFVYLFGKFIPVISLVISMIFRFIPLFKIQFKEVSKAQEYIGKGVKTGNFFKRIKNSLSILSIMLSWVLENSIDIADSMKSRGYGLKGRTTFSIFKFNNRDKKIILTICFFSIYTLIGNFRGGLYFRYYPSIKGIDISIYSLTIYSAYFLLCFTPIIIQFWEAYRWKSLKSKI